MCQLPCINPCCAREPDKLPVCTELLFFTGTHGPWCHSCLPAPMRHMLKTRLREVLHTPLSSVFAGRQRKASSHVHLPLKAEFFARLHVASLGLQGSSQDLAQPRALPPLTYPSTFSSERPFSRVLTIGVAIQPKSGNTWAIAPTACPFKMPLRWASSLRVCPLSAA